MTQDDIIRMAREAGLAYGSDEKPLASVTRFFHLAYAAGAAAAKAEEREAFLDLAESYAKNNTDLHDAIRARKEQP